MERYRRDPLSWDVPVEFAYRFGVGNPEWTATIKQFVEGRLI